MVLCMKFKNIKLKVGRMNFMRDPCGQKHNTKSPTNILTEKKQGVVGGQNFETKCLTHNEESKLGSMDNQEKKQGNMFG